MEEAIRKQPHLYLVIVEYFDVIELGCSSKRSSIVDWSPLCSVLRPSSLFGWAFDNVWSPTTVSPCWPTALARVFSPSSSDGESLNGES